MLEVEKPNAFGELLEADLEALEAQIGARLPEDYRSFHMLSSDVTSLGATSLAVLACQRGILSRVRSPKRPEGSVDGDRLSRDNDSELSHESAEP